MRTSYMPNQEAKAVEWSENFSDLINTTPELYGLTDALAQEFAALNATLQAAYRVAATLKTRTSDTIEAKTDALKAMKRLATKLVMMIQGYPPVNDAQRRALGITVRDVIPTPAPAPTVAPVLELLAGAPQRQFKVFISAPEDQPKPAGLSTTLFLHTGEDPPRTREGWLYLGTVTRKKVIVPVVPCDQPMRVWVSAFFSNKRGQSGPSGNAVSLVIPAGGELPKEVTLGGARATRQADAA